MMTFLERAKGNGAKIVAINPMPEPGLLEVVNPNPQEYRNPFKFAASMLFNKGTPLADLWLPVRMNGDMAVMRGIMKEMLAEEERQPGTVFDHEFIEQIHSRLRGVHRACPRDSVGRHSRKQRINARADPRTRRRSRMPASASSPAGRWD